MDEHPETLTTEEVRRAFVGGPDPKSALLVVIEDRMYRNEGGVWRLLDNRCYATVQEMTDVAGSD